MSYNALDIVVGIIFLSSIIVGTLRGFTKEVLSLVGWIAAFVIASRYAADMAALLPADWSVPAVRLALGFALLLIGVRLLCVMINALIYTLIRAAGLTLADHGMGSLFGLMRACVIVLSLGILAGLTELPRQPLWQEAFTSVWIVQAVRTVKPFLPENMAAYVKL